MAKEGEVSGIQCSGTSTFDIPCSIFGIHWLGCMHSLHG